MPFDITEFSSKIDRWGIQKASHYEVIITPPTGVDSIILPDIPIRANSANQPGVSISTDDIKHRGYGLNEKRAATVSYEDVTVTFIADNSGNLSKFFNRWNEKIFPTNDSIISRDAVEFFEYPTEYYGSLEINVFDPTGKIHSTWQLIDVFPTNIGGVQLSWESADTILILPVSFSYRSFKLEEKNSGQIE